MSKVVSAVTGRTYDDETNGGCVYFKNAKQSCFYVLHGAILLDVIPTNENRFIFVFSRDDHRRLINEWNNTRPQEI